MTDTQKTKNFDGKFRNQQVRVTYNLEKNTVRIVCRQPDTGSAYVRNLITGGHVGPVDAVIYSVRPDSRVVALMRGNGLDSFLRAGLTKAEKVPARKSFRDIIEKEESDTGS